LQAFELRDVYKSRRPSSVARLELVSAILAHCLIDAVGDTLIAFHMRDRFAHFTVGELAPRSTGLHTASQQPILPLGLDCKLIETSGFTNFVLPPADDIVVAVIDSINYHLDTIRGTTILNRKSGRHSAPSTCNADHRRTGRSRGYRYGLSGQFFHGHPQGSPKPHLPCATTLRQIRIRLMPDPINPRFLRIYRVP
jgi:hypothetical protein